MTARGCWMVKCINTAREKRGQGEGGEGRMGGREVGGGGGGGG